MRSRRRSVCVINTGSNASSRAPTPSWFYYDALGRLTSVKDPLGNYTSVSYDPVHGWVNSTTDPASNTTDYEYYWVTEANAGRIQREINALGKKTWYDYTSRGEPQHVWGDVPYPEERHYNDYGELTELRTFQGGTGWTSSETWPGAGVSYQSTVWNYDPATGLLISKVDASGHGYTNNYLATGTLWTKTWARGATITNTFNDYGEVIRKDYSDGTPCVVIDSMNWLGQPNYVTDVNGTQVITYDFKDRPLITYLSGSLSAFSLNNRYDSVYGRDRLTLELWGEPVLTNDFRYDSASGRLSVVSNSIFSATYDYLPNSDLLATTTCKSNTTTVLITTRSWQYGMRLGAIVNAVNGTVVSSHAYDYDPLNQRTRAALEDGSYWSYDYNDRNELTGAHRFWMPDWSPVSGQHFGYAYDNIGNRQSATFGGDANGWNLRTTTYDVNALNEYTNIVTPGYKAIVGAALATNGVTVNGGAADRKVEYYHREISVANSSGPVWQPVTNSSGGIAVTNGCVFPKNSQNLAYDLDGNLTFDGVWNYKWDGENRLISMNMTNVAGIASTNRLKLDFVYDYLGRRVGKIVSTNSTGSTFVAQSTNRYVYDGWNLVAVLDSSSSILQSFLWGLDISGTANQASGIDSLLMATVSGTNCFATYDGNGSVTALINVGDKSISARYEYSPFGELIRATGPLVRVNPFRFSTKFWDDDSGLIYFGYRYYSPTLGRWISRDPSGEEGSLNLFLAFLNNVNSYSDPDGQGIVPRKILALFVAAHQMLHPQDPTVAAKILSKMEKNRQTMEEVQKERGYGNKRKNRGAAGGGDDEPPGGGVKGRAAAIGAGLVLTATLATLTAIDAVLAHATGTAAISSPAEAMFRDLDRGNQGFADLDAIDAALEMTGGAAEDALVAWCVFSEVGDAYSSGL